MTTDCYPVPGPAHAATHATHAHHVQAGIPHGAVHHAPIHHLPVYGPPPPSVALNCVRTPGELPALPGGGAYPPVQGTQPGAGGLSQGFYGQGPAASAGAPFGSGALGLAQAALVAGGLGLAAAGGLAMVAPVSTGPAQPVGPIYANTSTSGDIGPGSSTPSSNIPNRNTAGPDVPAPDTTVQNTPGPVTGPTPGPIVMQSPPAGSPDTPQPDQPATPATPIPEPGTLLLFAAGALAAVAGRLNLRRQTPVSPTGGALS